MHTERNHTDLMAMVHRNHTPCRIFAVVLAKFGSNDIQFTIVVSNMKLEHCDTTSLALLT